MVDPIREDLCEYNYLYHAYKQFAAYEPHERQAHMELSLADPGRGGEIAALYHVGSAPAPSPRCLYVQRSRDLDSPRGIPVITEPILENKRLNIHTAIVSHDNSTTPLILTYWPGSEPWATTVDDTILVSGSARFTPSNGTVSPMRPSLTLLLPPRTRVLSTPHLTSRQSFF